MFLHFEHLFDERNHFIVRRFFQTVADRHAALDFDFLLVRVFLSLVVHVPTERNPEFIDIIEPRLRFGIFCVEISLLVCPEIFG